METEVSVQESAVVVECNDGERRYKIEKIDDKLVEPLGEEVPESVREAISEAGFWIA